MSTVFIIHGIEGSPEENWFPWLKNELEILNNKVIVPRFPEPANPNVDDWLKAFENYRKYLNSETIFIGHSLGCAFILRVLEKYSAGSAIFVAGFVGKTGNKFDERMKTFAQRTFDWKKIKANCKSFKTFYSDNDPYVDPSKAIELSRHLGITPTLIKNAGHFNSAAGYTEFPELLESLKTQS